MGGPECLNCMKALDGGSLMFKLYEGAEWGGPECLNCMKALDGGVLNV